MVKVNKFITANSESILVWLVCALYAGLFFPIAVNNFLLLVLIVFCLVRTKFSDHLRAMKGGILMQLIIGLFLAQMVGLVYTSNLKTGLFMLEKKVAFILVPFFLYPLLQKLSPDNLLKLKKSIGFITMLSSIVLLIIALFRYYVLGYAKAFFFESFRAFEGFTSIHYVYYSLYFAIGSLIFIESNFERLTQKKYGFWILLGLFTYDLGIITLVASKTGIAAFVSASLMLAYYKMKNKKIFIVSLTVIVLALTAFISFNKTTRDRFSELTKNLDILTKVKPIEPSDFNGLNVRFVFWKIQVTNLIKDGYYAIGVGTGDAQDYIDTFYKNFPNHAMEGYIGFDSHNQWVYSFVQLGLIGFLLLALLFGFGFKEAWEKRNINFFIFLFISFLFSLTESLLESNKGIVFFTLLFTIFSALVSKTSLSTNKGRR